MNKGVYQHPDNEAIAKLDEAIVGGLSLKGEVRSKLTRQAVDADMHFKANKSEHTIQGFSYRLKGYEVHLEPEQPYQLHVEALGYQPLDTLLTLTENTSLVLFLQPLEKGGKFVMDNIYFYPNTFAYKDESEAALNALTEYMLQHKKVRIEIQGHTNGNKDVRRSKDTEQSGAAWNYEGSAKELSRLRANVLRDYLVAKGVSSKRIVTVGKGGDEMIVPNPKDMTEAARNIRVEIRILEN
jgi:outer membrane protein OmpA-like peptidoglycan-associated protein